MRFALLLTCGVLMLQPGLCLGQDQTSLQLGKQALVSQLWEVAAEHFVLQLKQQDLSAEQRHEATFGLAEAWLRDGKAQQVLTLLNQSDLAQLPETVFWKGQALAATGRFAQAVETLTPLIAIKEFGYRVEAGQTVASLQLALDQSDDAIKTLSAVVQNSSPEVASNLRMRQVEILLDLGRDKQAAEILPESAKLSAGQQGAADFLRAILLERQGEHAKAAALFKQLAQAPDALDLKRHQDARIGQARCLLRLGQSDAAAEQLLNLVQEDPENARLDEIFQLILEAIPSNPTATDPILTRLHGWIGTSEKPPTGLIPTDECHAVSAWPDQTPTSDLTAFCLYTRAIGLSRFGTPDAKLEAHHLLTRLRLEYPTHFLTNRSLLIEAQWHLDNQQIGRAHHLLGVLGETATSPLIMGRAAFLQAQSTALLGSDPKAAAQLFEQAAAHLRGVEAEIAHYNAALIQLVQNHTGTDPVLATAPRI
ncbi:MAG TPA: tetratricopeptide repeat protein, partial [Luteolibacter sp.]|nr:tetratricopeptide repeat protein [Luteolibacter sp.]